MIITEEGVLCMYMHGIRTCQNILIIYTLNCNRNYTAADSTHYHNAEYSTDLGSILMMLQ